MKNFTTLNTNFIISFHSQFFQFSTSDHVTILSYIKIIDFKLLTYTIYVGLPDSGYYKNLILLPYVMRVAIMLLLSILCTSILHNTTIRKPFVVYPSVVGVLHLVVLIILVKTNICKRSTLLMH